MKILKGYSEYQKPGVYCLFNLYNQKFYIGSSINISKRVWEHFYGLKNNIHHNDHLQRSYNKHPNHFIGFVLEDVEEDNLIKREQYWIDRLEVCNPQIGYNILPTAYSFIGYRPSKETRKRMSIAKSGENHYNFGRQLSKTTRERIGNGNRGKVRSEATKQKLREINLGKTHSEDTKKKISDSMKKRVVSNDQLKQITNLNSKRAYQYDKDLNLVAVWDSAAEAGRKLGINSPQINRVCRKERKTYKSFIWRYNPISI